MKLLGSFRFFGVLLFLACPIFAQTSDEQAVRDLATKFCEAIRQKNVENLRRVLTIPDSQINDWKNEFEKGIYAQYLLKSFTFRTIKIEGERATVRMFWERLNLKTNENELSYGLNHFILSLQKTNSNWKILRNDTAENILISQIVTANSNETRKQIILEEKELNTFRMIFVILFRLKNEGNYELSEEYFKLAEWFGEEFYKGKKELDFYTNRLNILNARAAIQVSQGNYAEALQFYVEARRLGEEFQAKTGKIVAGVALTQVNIGDLYFRQGNFEQAERFANLALKTLEGADRTKQRVIFYSIYTLLGDLSAQRGEDEKAVEYYLQGDSLGIGAIYLKQGKLAEALKIFQREINTTERGILVKENLDLPRSVTACKRRRNLFAAR